MRDPRLTQLAYNLINHSCKLKKGERVLIENFGLEKELVCALVDEAYKAGAEPHVWLRDNTVLRAQLMHMSQEQAALWAQSDAAFMEKMDAYIGLRAGDNANEMSDVPAAGMSNYKQHYQQPVHSQMRVPHTKWVVLRYPTPSMAQSAQMSTQAFEDFYFNVCCLDYAKMGQAMDALVARMERTDIVHIVGPGDTDLTFSIKGLPAIKCAGELNIPDGEVFTAPIKNSVNGVLHYNTKTLQDGFTFDDVRLVFKDGKIVEATANNTEKINTIFDRDEGARYIGEFALGVNPYILTPMLDTLFDEKICGSFHFTPGNCYDEASNGNKSSLHWDMICIQREDYGGGTIHFDGELVRQDGLFVTEDLLALNPENLM